MVQLIDWSPSVLDYYIWAKKIDFCKTFYDLRKSKNHTRIGQSAKQYLKKSPDEWLLALLDESLEGGVQRVVVLLDEVAGGVADRAGKVPHQETWNEDFLKHIS